MEGPTVEVDFKIMRTMELESGAIGIVMETSSVLGMVNVIFSVMVTVDASVNISTATAVVSVIVRQREWS